MRDNLSGQPFMIEHIAVRELGENRSVIAVYSNQLYCRMIGKYMPTEIKLVMGLLHSRNYQILMATFYNW